MAKTTRRVDVHAPPRAKRSRGRADADGPRERPAQDGAVTRGKQPRSRRRRTASQAEVSAGAQDSGGYRATLWAYRQGLGDCFLLAFPLVDAPRNGRTHCFVLIDCGVMLGTPDAADKMTAVVRDIRTKLGPANVLDVLVATHEHWDHLSGFLQAQAEFAGLTVGEVWLAWTEDPDDRQAKALAAQKEQVLAALRLAAPAVRLAGDEEQADALEGVLGFFGAAKRASTKDALSFVRGLGGARVVYREPGEPPIGLPDVAGTRVFVLGPPRDEAMLKRTNPRHSNHEAYELALDLFLHDVAPSLLADPVPPFHAMSAIPIEVAREMDFFKTRYWEAGTIDQGWRRIDSTWAAGATELALHLDNMTNNTSLVLAFEFPDGDVLLFVADAQVGNWLSWQELRWETDRGPVSGPDLLGRAVFYKVGHHGSHNATLSRQGLEIMTRLQAAFIPVDRAVALKKQWNRMPLEALVVALEAKVPGHVLRSDLTTDVRVPGRIETTGLYFELTF